MTKGEVSGLDEDTRSVRRPAMSDDVMAISYDVVICHCAFRPLVRCDRLAQLLTYIKVLRVFRSDLRQSVAANVAEIREHVGRDH